MIIDSVRSFETYVSLHHSFDKVLDFIRHNDLHTLTLGKHIIEEGNIWCSIAESTGKGFEVLPKMEVHDSFIDIHVLLEGNETIGFKDRALCHLDGVHYDEVKDVALFEEEPDVYVNCGLDNFVICYPKDGHTPLLGEGSIKKAIFKVRV